MKKIITKFSLLFIGLMLCAGNAWAADDRYHEPAGNSGTGYYEEEISDVTYRIDYTFTKTDNGPLTQVTRTAITDEWDGGAHAYITNFDEEAETIELVHSISFNIVEMSMGGNVVMSTPYTYSVCIETGLFLNYTGNIILPAYDNESQYTIFYKGYSDLDARYLGNDYENTFNATISILVPTDVDKDYYEIHTKSYKEGDITRVFYPWEGHVTAKDSWTPPAEPSEPVTSGTCGTNLNWEYGGYVLRLYRPDETQPATMSDFENNSESVVQVSSAPWYEYHNDIRVINLPDGLTNIGDWAFYACSLLVASPTIPESVLSIGEESFASCASITEIDLPDGLTSIGNGAFRTCSSLAEIAIPSGVTTINFETFAYCEALKKVTFPETLTTIGNSAFAECFSLRSIVLPENLSSIGYGAFVNTDKAKGTLSTITMKGNTPPTLGETSFTYIYTVSMYAFNDTIDVYVPAGSKDAYIAAWGTEKGDATTAKQHYNYVFNYHEYGFDEDDKTGYFHDATSGVTASVIEELVSEAEQVHEVTIVRPIQANGKLNTICLPFALTAQQITNSDLSDATIYAFTATDDATAEALLTLSPVTSMEAGVPYFIAYKNGHKGSSEMLQSVTFHEVLFSTYTESPVDLGAGDYILHGTLQPTLLNNEDNYLFLGANNAVFYPDLDGTTEEERTIKPFRAYFSIADQVAHTPARIVFGRNTATNVENAQEEVQTIKTIENGSVVILRNGVRYNVAGQVIE